jgi:hypothetical protein
MWWYAGAFCGRLDVIDQRQPGNLPADDDVTGFEISAICRNSGLRPGRRTAVMGWGPAHW